MNILSPIIDALGASPLLAIGLSGSVSILAASFALGIRHGIDWDHIAAITDITSTSVVVRRPDEDWLVREPGLMLTDEGHHALHSYDHTHGPMAEGASDAVQWNAEGPAGAHPTSGAATMVLTPPRSKASVAFVQEQRRALFLGTLYAAGHATMVIALGLLAIVASGFLPGWIDPIMERVVGVTLLFLSGYLFYSLYRFFRRGGDFRIRSRWMLVFAAVANAYRWVTAKVQGRHEHRHVAAPDQYGARMAYGIGLVHGIGAETGTQVLVIATAVGAGSKAMSVAVLFTFVAGLLVSNSLVTFMTTAGFISSGRRQGLYAIAGAVAAVFSLVVGLVFLFHAGGLLPNLNRLVSWVGGPAT